MERGASRAPGRLDYVLELVAAVALALSVISLVASAAAAWYTRHTALTERERLHRERQPVVRATFDSRSDPRGTGAELEVVAFTYVAGPGPLSRVEIELVHRSEATNPPIMSIGAALEPPTGTVVALDTPFALGQERIVSAVRHVSDPGGVAPFRIRCNAGEESWEFAIECDVPPVPGVVFAD